MRMQVRGFKFRRVLGLIATACLLGTAVIAARAQQPVVEKLVLDDTIQPVSAGMLDRAIAHANGSGAAALLIEMNTPGGLVDSMRTMAGAILGSRVPVIIYVAPAGARAGSAGFFLLESADVAAMAPGTNAGAAHVVFEGGKPDETLSQKMENDAEAFLRSYVARAKPQHRCGHCRGGIVALLHGGGGAEPAPDRRDRAERRRVAQCD